MARATRSFKLRLSPAGLDVLIASHCYLIRETRSLLAWGTTLHVAVEHLGACSVDHVGRLLSAVEAQGLWGDEEHHLGAPHRLGDLALDIIERYRANFVDKPVPTLGNLYIAALVYLAAGEAGAISTAFRRVQFESGRPRAV